MARHNELGKMGEQLAVEFLVKQGFIIRETNWRMFKLEIDIIAQDSSRVLHIVEVKTRSSDDHFDPMKAINIAKKRHMVASANGYIHYFNLHCEIQYDVIIVIGTPEKGFKLEYYPDMFVPKLKTY